MIIELHMLQNFAPSCLNRDDTNAPKDCEFGGYRRARISSQCIKRSLRRHFTEAKLLSPDKLAHRTKRLVESELPRRLMRDGRTAEQIRLASVRALAGGGLKVDEETYLTQYLLFLGDREIDQLADLIDRHWTDLTAATPTAAPTAAPERKKTSKQQKSDAKEAVPEEVRKGILKLLDGGNAADLALFGRMLADLPEKNIEAACQVAHAISANHVSMEMDYFTAVDDLQPNDSDAGAGAGMIGSVEFNSSCFYRYANIDTEQLSKNLHADHELAREATLAFLRASVDAIPTGKQNTFAAHNPPDFVMAVVRSRGQTNLANAFVKPIRPTLEHSLVEGSVQAIDKYWSQAQKISKLPESSTVTLVTTTEGGLAHLKDHELASVDAVFEKVAKALVEAS